jgi:hypothetical protein
MKFTQFPLHRRNFCSTKRIEINYMILSFFKLFFFKNIVKTHDITILKDLKGHLYIYFIDLK